MKTTQGATVYCEVASSPFGKLCLNYNIQILSKEKTKTNLLLSNLYVRYRWNTILCELS